MSAVAERQLLALPAALAAALLGVLIGLQPLAAIALAGLAGLMLLTLVAPIAHLTLLIILTAIVPHQLQNAVGGGGAGLVASDAVLLTGLARGAFVLAQRRLRTSEVVGIALTLLVLAAAALQFVHGVRGGAPLNVAGDELRTLLGFGVVLVALPILQDEELRPRLLKALLGIGLLLGLWGSRSGRSTSRTSRALACVRGSRSPVRGAASCKAACTRSRSPSRWPSRR